MGLDLLQPNHREPHLPSLVCLSVVALLFSFLFSVGDYSHLATSFPSCRASFRCVLSSLSFSVFVLSSPAHLPSGLPWLNEFVLFLFMSLFTFVTHSKSSMRTILPTPSHSTLELHNRKGSRASHLFRHRSRKLLPLPHPLASGFV